MRDAFDEFLEELKRRQNGESAGPAGDGSNGEGPDDEDEGTTPDRAHDADSQSSAGAGEDAADDDSRHREPEVLSARRRTSTGGGGGRSSGRGRRPGGPNDGSGLRDSFGRYGRRIVLVVVVVLIVLLLTVAGSGVDLWTDAIWFRSVGFDSVFFTRLDAQFVLFLLGLAIGLAVLLGTLWLAGRMSPPANPDGRGSIAAFLERLNDAANAQDRTAFGNYGGTGGFRGRGRPDGAGFRGRYGGDVSFGGGSGFDADDLPDLTPIGRWVLIGLGILIAIGVGASLAGDWETILLWQHQTTFAAAGAPAVTDPVFGRDIGFFLFQLPFLRLVQGAVNGLLLAALFLALARYGLAALRGSLSFSTPIRVHLAILGGLYLVSVAAGYQLDKFELVYSTQGVATGVSYADFNARFFAFDALTVVAALAGALLVAGAFTKLIWPLGLAVGAWILATVVLAGIYPQVVQRFTVDPNRYAEEQPFIANNIQMTRLAYGLDTWATSDYSGNTPLTPTVVDQEEATFQNARLWDFAPLGSTLDQIQTVRSYYDFTDVDTDRYDIDGATRQVMVSGRELAQDRAPASSWVNQKLTYTHGIGAAMVPVNEVTPEGLPHLLIRDLPPVSDPSVPAIKQPRIYFGERSSDYVIVDARQPEFDYPSGGTAGTSTGADAGTQTSWSGETGIPLNSTLNRLLFAFRFRDLNLLISDQVTAQSQLLMHRTLSDRISRVAPFLYYDADPYLVVGADGNLYYVQDAYTISDRFPNAQAIDTSTLPNDSGLRDTDLDYVRNSVKVVMNAYDGTMTFYAADPNDPILRAYEGVFPTLFQPLSTMPADLRAHLRVPEDLFDVQTRMYAAYHVTDTETFFRGADLWQVPQTPSNSPAPPSEPNYVEMRLPGETSTEFLLLQPMVPNGRPNMISWVAARNDDPNYGQVHVYRFPQDTAVRGPTQIEAQIAADPVISAQKTLWDQSGSSVVFGHLIVVPVQNSVVYLQPVFLQSTSSAFPAFQKLIVATSTKIVWGNSLADALNLLIAGGPSPTPTPGPTQSPSPGASGPPPASGSPGPSVGPTVTPSGPPPSGAIPPPPAGDVAALVAYANFHFEQAQEALRAGDFARYGQEIAAVQQALALLSQLVGSPAPSGLPPASIVPPGASVAPVASPSP